MERIRELSPIEQLLREALQRVVPTRGFALVDVTDWVFDGHRLCVTSEGVCDAHGPNPEVRPTTFGRAPEADEVWLTPQVGIGGYRADFFLFREGVSTNCPGLVVECDGHEWHERTQQQASYDRSRDRALLRLGIPTIRFTGSDINRDADQCATEVLDSVLAIERWRKGRR